MRVFRLSVAAAALSTVFALLIELAHPIRWWHPDCLSGDAVPYATGFPLPYSQWSMASSMEYFVSIPALMLDVSILGILFFPLSKMAVSRVARSGFYVKITSAFVFSLLCLVTAFGFCVSTWPVITIAGQRESYFQYRPTLMEPKAGPTCEVYD